MRLHVDDDIQISAALLAELVRHGFVGVATSDVDVRVLPAAATLRRWVRLCHDPATCGHPVDLDAAGCAGHTAASERRLAGLDPSSHGSTRELAVQPRYAYTGRVRDRDRHGVTSRRRFLVTLRIPSDPSQTGDEHPRRSRDPRRRDAPVLHLRDWREEIVRLVAHEAWHVHQHRTDVPRSETDAERWAASRLDAYRAVGERARTALHV